MPPKAWQSQAKTQNQTNNALRMPVPFANFRRWGKVCRFDDEDNWPHAIASLHWHYRICCRPGCLRYWDRQAYIVLRQQKTLKCSLPLTNFSAFWGKERPRNWWNDGRGPRGPDHAFGFCLWRRKWEPESGWFQTEYMHGATWLRHLFEHTHTLLMRNSTSIESHHIAAGHVLPCCSRFGPFIRWKCRKYDQYRMSSHCCRTCFIGAASHFYKVIGLAFMVCALAALLVWLVWLGIDKPVHQHLLWCHDRLASWCETNETEKTKSLGTAN